MHRKRRLGKDGEAWQTRWDAVADKSLSFLEEKIVTSYGFMTKSKKMMGEEREVLQKELFRRNPIVFFWRSLGIRLRVANDPVLMLWRRIDRVKLELQLL
jgi:hypothetical protein